MLLNSLSGLCHTTIAFRKSQHFNFVSNVSRDFRDVMLGDFREVWKTKRNRSLLARS